MAVLTYSLKRDGNTYLSKNFKVREFRCKDGSDTILIDTNLVDALQAIRDHFGKAVNINSAYRTASYNKKVGGSSGSQHLYGTAADIYISGVDPLKIAMFVASLPYFQANGGIGLYSRASGVTAGFVHVDTRSAYSRWTSKSGTSYVTVSKIMPTVRQGSRDRQSGIGYSVTILQRH